jgi:hypothetical protein
MIRRPRYGSNVLLQPVCASDNFVAAKMIANSANDYSVKK